MKLGNFEFKEFEDKYNPFYYCELENCILVYSDLIQNANLGYNGKHYYKDQKDKDYFYNLYNNVWTINNEYDTLNRYFRDLCDIGILAIVLVINKENKFDNSLINKLGYYGFCSSSNLLDYGCESMLNSEVNIRLEKYNNSLTFGQKVKRFFNA